MEDTKIEFKTARLAKEKGFPQDLFNTSWYNDLGDEHGRTDLDKDGNPYNGNFIPLELKEQYRRESFIAPKQALLQKWLREVYSIHVDAHPTFVNKMWYPKAVKLDNTNDDLLAGRIFNFHRDTYEEAFELGLKETLELLKLWDIKK